jgi:hypothetical protein
MSECICKGNWRRIIKESQELLGRNYKGHDGNTYVFDSVTWAKDDFYYLMLGFDGAKDQHLSCVGSIEMSDFTLLDQQPAKEKQ